MRGYNYAGVYRTNGHTLKTTFWYGTDGTYPGTFDGQNVYNGWSFREKAK